MKVHVRLWGYLTRYVPNRNAAEPTAIEVSEGAQVREAMQQLGIPDLSFDLVFVNGVPGNASSLLQEGDLLGIFPRLIAGG